jgi:hypothetical protein
MWPPPLNLSAGARLMIVLTQSATTVTFQKFRTLKGLPVFEIWSYLELQITMSESLVLLSQKI